MNTKDLAIYNAVAKIAADIFKNNMPYLQPGKYSVNDILKLQKKTGAQFDALDENEIIHFEFDGFSCKFAAGDIFNILGQMQTAWGINTAARAEFIKTVDAAPVAVSFSVPQLAKNLFYALTPEKDQLLTATKYFCVDTERRALIGANGKILTAVAVPNMYINQDAAANVPTHPSAPTRLLIDPILLKSGKGTLKIDANGNAVNGTQTRPVCDFYHFPAWFSVLNKVSEAGAVKIGPAFKEMKKAILAAAKFSDKTTAKTVILRAVPGIAELQIIGFRAEYDDEKTAKETKLFKIALPDPVPFAFTVAIDGTAINAVGAADKMYLRNENAPVIFAAADYFALLMPIFLDSTPWKNEKFTAPAGAEMDLLSICNFPALGADNTPAALASVEDAPAVAAAAECAPYFNITETGAENSVYIKRYADFETPYYLDVAPADNVPAVEDAAALLNAEDADEINAAYFDNLSAEDAEKARLAFAVAAADNVPADSVPAADPESVPTCAADSAPDTNSAPAEAVSLPVPVAAVYPLHAVYIDHVLNGVYFSKLLADEIFWSAFFAGRAVYDLEILSNETAPETERAAVARRAESCKQFAAVQDAQADQDKETPAADSVPAFASVFAIMPEIWDNSAAPADVPSISAPACAADSVPTPGDDSAAPADNVPAADSIGAVLIAANFAARARRVWQIVAVFAVLLLITAAPRSVNVPADIVPTCPRSEYISAPADNVPAADFVPAVAAESVAADSVPAAEKTSTPAPQKRAKRARRAAASVQGAPAVAVAAADSLKTCAADSVPAVAADSVPTPGDDSAAPAVAADNVPADSVPTSEKISAPTPGDDSAAPAADPESVPADNVPADSVPAPAPGAVSVPAVAAAASVGPAAAVLALFITL